MEATFEKRKYWEIAKPLVDELCSQWASDHISGYSPGPSEGALPRCMALDTSWQLKTNCDRQLAYLRNMYQELLPNMALFPEAANPLHYVEAIENHLSGSITADLNGTSATLRVGIKRKRELHKNSLLSAKLYLV
ncbi:hypothetical protein EYZ11_013068 [Aspergillus tanneri]|uniref:Uncharacterized protein n=1 Tax=Aspergillus tanneri TaxID=1220188 RepID=A0A4S3J0Q7_9EURO|nr:hypothetical protein EYZ11_013068 [Aspergillus tanneri]